jgi:hypothetical protein
MVLNPTDKLLDSGMRAFDAGAQIALKKNPDEAAVYAKNPGLLEAILAAGRPIARKHLAASIPLNQQRYARLYAENFTPAEIDQLIAFYTTPTGVKVVAALYSGITLENLIERTDDKGELHLTPNMVGETTHAAVAGLPDQLDAEDWKTLLIFMGTPAHAKLRQLAPEFNRIAAEIGNSDDPEMDAEMNKAVEATVKAYLAKKGRHS